MTENFKKLHIYRSNIFIIIFEEYNIIISLIPFSFLLANLPMYYLLTFF